MPLDVRTVISTVENTVLDILDLGLAWRLPAVADLAALAAAPVTATRDRALRYVTSEDRLYRWTPASTAAHAPPDVVQPAALPANGRWLRVTSASTYGPNNSAPLHSRQTGYCRAVDLYQGEGPKPDEPLVNVFGQLPACLVEWLGDNPLPRSQYPGALYWAEHELQVLCMSSCLRPGPGATLQGSPIPAELAKDPGLNRLIGDVRYLLAGVITGVDGIESIEIGRADIISEDLEERLFIAAVQIKVRTAWYIPDEDLVDTLIEVSPRFPVDFEDPGEFDRLNYVASGYRAAVGPGLTRSWGVGTAFIGGAAVSSTPAPKTFAANRDTYRDLKPDGTFVYTEVTVAGPRPPLTAGALRVGVTTTDGSSIVQDKILCSCSYAYAPFAGMLVP